MTESHSAFVEENIVTAFQVGAMVGSLVAYPAAHYLGRRLSLVWFSILLMLGSGLTLGANHARGLTLIFAGRTFTGIGVGACCMVTPIYLSEISPPAIRGRVCGIFELFWQIGSVAGFWYAFFILRLRSEANVCPCKGSTTQYRKRWSPLASNGYSHS